MAIYATPLTTGATLPIKSDDLAAEALAQQLATIGNQRMVVMTDGTDYMVTSYESWRANVGEQSIYTVVRAGQVLYFDTVSKLIYPHG